MLMLISIIIGARTNMIVSQGCSGNLIEPGQHLSYPATLMGTSPG